MQKLGTLTLQLSYYKIDLLKMDFTCFWKKKKFTSLLQKNRKYIESRSYLIDLPNKYK